MNQNIVKNNNNNNNKLTIYGIFALSCFCTYLPLYSF